MAIKTFNPTTPSRRHMTVLDKSGLSKKGPEKSLTKGISATGNIPTMGIVRAGVIDVYDIMSCEKILFTKDALDAFIARLA